MGCGITGNIYAGELNEHGNAWTSRSDVTNEAMASVAEYMVCNHKEYRFQYRGESYVLKVESGQNENQNN